MKPHIVEYGEAIEAHLEALKNEMVAKQTVRATYYRLMQAREAIHLKEREIIEDIEKITLCSNS